MIFLLLLVTYSIVLSVALMVAGAKPQPIAARGVPHERPKRVLIIGATGGTGRELVAQALERGYEVTAIARNPAKLSVSHASLHVVQGDVLDASSVEAAVRGQDAVLSALGHRKYFPPSRILSNGTRNILHAMESQRVSRFVCETSLGVGNSVGRMGVLYTFFNIPLVLPFYYWDKTRQERAIAASHLDWVIVRPAALMNGEKRGRVRHGNVGSFLWTNRISRADTAAFMLDQLESDEYLRQTPGISW